MNTGIIGVDVSKDTLVVCEPDGKPFTVANNKQGIKSLLKRLAPDTVVAMEATAKYHRLLADSACREGMSVYVFNPKDAKYYAKSVSPRAKTDRVDAKVIALYARDRAHRLYKPPEEFIDKLKSLVRMRGSLVGQSVALKAQIMEYPELARDLKEAVARIETCRKSLEKQILELAGRIPEYEYMLTVKGFGELTAAYMSAMLASGDFRNSDSFVAFLGMDLRVSESGKRRGRRILTKRGDPEARRLLYMAAKSASSVEGPLKDLKLRYIARGYSKVEAIVIVARKMARIAWAIYTKKEAYRPERVLSQSGTQTKVNTESTAAVEQMADSVADKGLDATESARGPDTGPRATQEDRESGRKKAG